MAGGRSGGCGGCGGYGGRDNGKIWNWKSVGMKVIGVYSVSSCVVEVVVAVMVVAGSGRGGDGGSRGVCSRGRKIDDKGQNCRHQTTAHTGSQHKLTVQGHSTTRTQHGHSRTKSRITLFLYDPWERHL